MMKQLIALILVIFVFATAGTILTWVSALGESIGMASQEAIIGVVVFFSLLAGVAGVALVNKRT